jgi:FkbM family methyltransferase
MWLRGWFKRLLYSVSGSFPYFGHIVYFPPRSHVFMRMCTEGIYERETTNLLTSLIKPHTTFIDVGANIGLLSIPILARNPHTRIVSIEASPATAHYLTRTWSRSPYRDRWTIIESAIGQTIGEVDFWAGSAGNGAFDGLSDTGRGGPKRSIKVKVQTLDQIWRDLDEPAVSAVKIDVEGGERGVLAGACRMISRQRPAIVIEWSGFNLPAYAISPRALFDVCREIQYRVYAYPNLCVIDSELLLQAAMTQTETFLLVPSTH